MLHRGTSIESPHKCLLRICCRLGTVRAWRENTCAPKTPLSQGSQLSREAVSTQRAMWSGDTEGTHLTHPITWRDSQESGWRGRQAGQQKSLEGGANTEKSKCLLIAEHSCPGQGLRVLTLKHTAWIKAYNPAYQLRDFELPEFQ